MLKKFFSLFHRMFHFGIDPKVQEPAKHVEPHWPEDVKITPSGKIYITTYPSSLSNDDIRAELQKGQPDMPEDPRLAAITQKLDDLQRHMQQTPAQSSPRKLDLILR